MQASECKQPSMQGDEFLRGAKYAHHGPCDGPACSKCYKYACPICHERSNLIMSCLFCEREARAKRAHELPLEKDGAAVVQQDSTGGSP